MIKRNSSQHGQVQFEAGPTQTPDHGHCGDDPAGASPVPSDRLFHRSFTPMFLSSPLEQEHMANHHKKMNTNVFAHQTQRVRCQCGEGPL